MAIVGTAPLMLQGLERHRKWEKVQAQLGENI